MATVTVLGGGSWGTTIAHLLGHLEAEDPATQHPEMASRALTAR